MADLGVALIVEQRDRERDVEVVGPRMTYAAPRRRGTLVYQQTGHEPANDAQIVEVGTKGDRDG